MKKTFHIILALLLATASFQALATAQYPDYLIYKGDTLKMQCNPLEPYLKTHPNPIYDSIFNINSSACWRGYIAYWKIRNDSLFLVDIYGWKTKSRFLSMELESIDKSLIFKHIDASHEIFASWVSTNLETVWGDLVFYIHMGYKQIYQYEQKFCIRKGKVKSITKYDNSKSYIPFDDTFIGGGLGIANDYLQYNFDYSKIKNVPEKSTKILVWITNVGEDGSIRKVRADNYKHQFSKDVLREAERVTKSIPRWNVYYHHGKLKQIPAYVSIYICDSLRQLQSKGMQPFIEKYSDEYYIINEKIKLRNNPTDSHLANEIGDKYYKYAKIINKLTSADMRYDSLYLQMFKGDSNVLWHYRLRHSADSALKYYYLNRQLTNNQHYYNYHYIKQLEYHLGVIPNHNIQLPEEADSCYFGREFLVNAPANWMEDFNVDLYKYFIIPQSTKNQWEILLHALQEPNLNQGTLSGCAENLRFTWRRDVYVPIIIRVNFSENQATLIWKEGANERSFKSWDADSIGREGSRLLTADEYTQLQHLIQKVNFPQQPLNHRILASTTWLFEYRTSNRFDVIEQTEPTDAIKDLGLLLIRWTDLKLELDY